MAQNTKISIRKVIQVFLTLVLTTCCVVAMVSASKVEESKKVVDVEVHITSGKKYHFIEEQKIRNEAIENRNIDIKNTALRSLDLRGMEKVLEDDPWIAQAQLYIDNNRILHISVTGRIPIARLFKQNGENCYMDNTLHIMPDSPGIVYYTPVVTNVPELSNDSTSTAFKKQLLVMLHAIQADTFWNVQVSQIIIDSNNGFELVPVLGGQLIIFGDTSRLKEKFSNLYAFYNKVLNRIGWDKYETLDARFKGQIIAQPLLPYKGPANKDSTTVNWLATYVQEETRKDSIIAAAEQKPIPAALAPQKPKAAGPAPLLKGRQDKAVALAPKKETPKEVKKEKDIKPADTKKKEPDKKQKK